MKEIYTIGLFKNGVLIEQCGIRTKEKAIELAKEFNDSKSKDGVWKVMKYGRAVIDRSVEND